MECPCELIIYLRAQSKAVCASFRECILKALHAGRLLHTRRLLQQICLMSGLWVTMTTVVPHASECSVTERMKGQLVLALCTSLILVSGALEHRLHARETDEASGGGKNTHTLTIS